MPVTGETILSRVHSWSAISTVSPRRTFDVLVVGGGIYGLTIAYDAAQRGLSIGADRAAGLRRRRVLQPPPHDPRWSPVSADARHPRARASRFANAPRSLASRRRRFGRCPSSCRSIDRSSPASWPCAPVFSSIAVGRVRSQSRRSGCAPASGRTPGVARRRRPAVSGLRRQGLTAAAVWHDYVTVESDRLTFSVALAADQHGAALANYIEAIALLVDRASACVGVRARDVRIAAGRWRSPRRLTVNATGPPSIGCFAARDCHQRSRC